MKMNEILHERYSCREFDLSRKVPEADMRLILEAGRLSPSSLALEPWKFVVVAKDAQKSEIAKIANSQSQVEKCDFAVIFLARLDFKEYFVDRLKARGLSEEHFNARVKTYTPFLEAMKDSDKYAYATAQNHLAMMSMLLTASSVGVDSCFIGGFDKAKMDEYLKLDTKVYKSCVMAVFGYRKEGVKASPKVRCNFEDIVEFL